MSSDYSFYSNRNNYGPRNDSFGESPLSEDWRSKLDTLSANYYKYDKESIKCIKAKDINSAAGLEKLSQDCFRDIQHIVLEHDKDIYAELDSPSPKLSTQASKVCKQILGIQSSAEEMKTPESDSDSDEE